MIIRKMMKNDTDSVIAMMRVFYDSPAVLHKGSEEIFRRDIADCTGDCPYVYGYVFCENGEICGYSMIARGYSTEYGGECIWIEDLYVKPEYRGHGIGTEFFSALEREYRGKAVRYRLEAEESNENAVKLYKKCGFKVSPYVVLDKEV